MTRTLLRFNLGTAVAPVAERARLYADALDLAVAADHGGVDEVTFSEHHATDSGSCTAPLLAAAGALASTARVSVSASAVLLPLHDPVRLAEDIAFLDAAHPERLRVVAGLGYRPEEYALFGRDFRSRGRLMDDGLRVVLDLWRSGRVPLRSDPADVLAVGGQGERAARRAVEHRLPFAPRGHLPALRERYEALCAAAGVEPRCWMPSARFHQVHLSEDPDAAWAAVGRWYLADAREYAGWQRGGPTSPVFADAVDAGALRASGAVRVLTPDECIALAAEDDDTTLCLHPLAGGMPTDDAWASLRLFVDRVLPRLPAATTAPSARGAIHGS